MYFPFLLK